MAVLLNLNLFTLMKRYLAAQPTQSTEATIYAIDGQRVDIRLAGGATLLRNVQCMGDPTALEIGQAVPLLWDDNTPIVLALTSDGSVPVAATVVTDNITIENSTFGLRVKPGGVQPWHLSFTPSIEGHTHQDMLQMAGWRVNEAGTIFKGDTRIYDTGQIGLGAGESVIVLDALDLQYRMYSGASDPAYAPFAIMADGSMRATAGTIGGWEIFSNRLANNNIWLDPAGWIKIGFTGITGQNDDNAIYMTSTTDTAWEHDWAFWIGAEYPEDAPFRVTKGGSTWMTDAYIAVNLQSDNYVAGQLGWKLDPTGTLEAQNAIIRGEIRSSVFVSGTTTVTSGKQVVSDATIFVANVGPTDDTIDVAEAAFEVDDMVLVQPDSGRMEWMRITGGPFALTDGAFQYEVLRDLDGTGANQFWEGENIHREGGATYPDPAPLWGDPYALLGFEGPWGGPGFKAMGGFLIYDGSRDTGPYFAVRRRFGASWNQMSDVVRIGRLKGFLGYEIDEYGFGVGSLDSNMFFTQRDGMSLVMGNGQTSINADGVASERFGLWFADTEPGYTDGMVRFWVDQTTRRVYANFKDGAFEEEAVWLDFTSGGSISDNSDMVDGIHASAYVTPNYLLALNSSGKLPTDITGDADTLDNYHASSFSLSDHAHEGDFLTQAEADILYLALAGGTMAGQLNMTDTVKIGFGTSFLQGNASLGRIDIAGTSRLRMLIGADSHIEIESGQIYLNRSVNVMGGYDLIVYSDAGMTEVARIDGATGTYNGVDVGALDDDDGADIIGYRDGYSVGWTMDRMATMAMLVAPEVNTETGLNLNWGEGTFLAAGAIYDTLGDMAALTDDDVNYLVWGESTDTSELTIVLTHDSDTEVLVAEIVCTSGVGIVTMAPTLNLLARDAWYLAQNSTCTVSGTTGNLVSIATDGTLEDSGYHTSDYANVSHDHDGAYIGLIAVPTGTEGNIPIITSWGGLEDSTYDPTDFAASSHDHDDLYYTETELQTSGQSSVHWDNITDAPSLGGEWTLDTSNYLFPNLETAMVVIGSTIGSGSEILQVTGDTALYGNLTISGGGTIDLNGSLLTAVSAQIYLSAAGGIPKTTAGCSAPTQIELATNDQNFYVLDFDSTAQEYADWAFVLPGDYDGTMGMNATFVWKEKSGATSHDVVWGIRGVCYASDDPLDVAEGGTVEITASAGNANDVYFSLQTDSITWAGTPEGGQLIHITVYRNPTDTSDTLDTDARLLGVQLTYTRI